jgi:hypothetical protein
MYCSVLNKTAAVADELEGRCSHDEPRIIAVLFGSKLVAAAGDGNVARCFRRMD